ncbi:hypothetical protein A2U01_0012982, partial [Trifolium medium]|nr:hypothetical protein [Trifolium medium]
MTNDKKHPLYARALFGQEVSIRICVMKDMRHRNCRILIQQFHNLLEHIRVRMEPVMNSVPDSINCTQGISIAKHVSITPTHKL